ncbi:transporter substrate-binding domain-containing protein [Megalodesulfovibrio gigas]|uniref:Putative ABC transporter periplasmic protein n=1 Tax=Megalodesulfovibrio gigas (strain ATCC 19364 / DSM 1382 / NCIMB 9332 / VKM B-1759) TaxID=1121448 RepID=T2GD53_MEGG1|nr:transporter substrate-binding domain-containing protein [Megalodesulfovibrio gigas]AGW14233.1 putative ABC transporter periplasmic protein [Megalodesulfovibrio gigas DSM 1382 = ATCC 19364]
MVFGFDRDFPPFSFERDGTPVGFDIDLFQACLEGRNVRLSFKAMSWEQIQLELSAGRIHATAGMAKTPKRELLYDFSHQPTARLEVRLYTRNAQRVAALEQLRGKAVSVERGTIYLRLLEDFGGLIVRSYPSPREALQAMARGEVDAFAGADKTASYLMRRLPLQGVSPVGMPLAVMPMHFAISKETRALKEMLDQGFRRILENGKYAELYRKWFIPDLAPGDISRLVEAARSALIYAYAPYSQQPRGAAAMGQSGTVYTAGSVEHAEPSLGAGATRVAVLKAISSGETDIKAVAEVDQNGHAVTPAGEVVDLLMEFGVETQAVTEPEKGRYTPRALMELMPYTRPRTPGREMPDIPWLERGEQQ